LNNVGFQGNSGDKPYPLGVRLTMSVEKAKPSRRGRFSVKREAEGTARFEDIIAVTQTGCVDL
jgi:hypothetical protein